jgi:hypothetical protein
MTRRRALMPLSAAALGAPVAARARRSRAAGVAPSKAQHSRPCAVGVSRAE